MTKFIIPENFEFVAFRAIVYSLMNNEKGGTLDFNGHKVRPKKGYFVSSIEPSLTVGIDKLDISHFKSFFEACERSKSLGKYTYFGYWIDDDLIYLDLSFYFPIKKEAIKFGKSNNQRAIWDCKNNVEIYL